MKRNDRKVWGGQNLRKKKQKRKEERRNRSKKNNKETIRNEMELYEVKERINEKI